MEVFLLAGLYNELVYFLWDSSFSFIEHSFLLFEVAMECLKLFQWLHGLFVGPEEISFNSETIMQLILSLDVLSLPHFCSTITNDAEYYHKKIKQETLIALFCVKDSELRKYIKIIINK